MIVVEQVCPQSSVTTFHSFYPVLLVSSAEGPSVF